MGAYETSVNTYQTILRHFTEESNLRNDTYVVGSVDKFPFCTCFVD
jgi:hypothetical protein